ncbi:MAG: serine/threonine-protein kinase [Candidatus Eisenbacteria bacterium]
MLSGAFEEGYDETEGFADFASGRPCVLCEGDGALGSSRLPNLTRNRRADQGREPAGEGGAPGSSPPTDAASGRFSAGTVLARRFRIEGILGRGGMGEVYQAFDLELEAPIALKVLRPELASSRGAAERLKREVVLARRVTHPNVCRTFDLWRHRGKPGSALFLTMELLIGESLEDRLARRGRLPFAEVRELAKPLLRALHAAHRAQVVHRDLKPGNVMLIPREDGEQVLVTDFGVAVATSGPSASSGWLGSPGYMAPEQLRGDTVGPAADIYALGTLLFEALTGRLPYEVDPHETLPDLLRRRLRHEPPALRTYLPEIDARWEAAIHRCLSRDARDRFPSCEDLLRALGLEGERRVESIVFLTPSLVTEVADGADSADVGWPSLVHDLVSGLVARGDEIRVPRSQDVARVERDLGIDVSEPAEADIVRIVQAFGVQRAALLRLVQAEGGRLVPVP